MNFIFNDASSSAIYVVVSSIVGLLLTTMSLSYLGADLYGLWVLILTILVLGMFAENGLGLPIIRLINIENMKKNQEITTTCIPPILFIAFLLFFILILANDSFIYYLDNSAFEISHSGKMILPLMGFIVLIFLLSIIPSSFLIGYKKLYLVNYIKTLSRILQLIAAFILFKFGFNLWSVIFALLFYHLGVLFFSIFFALKIFKFKRYNLQFFNKTIFFELFRVGYKIVVARVIGIGIDPLFKYSLGAFLGLKFVAFFDIAFKLNSLITQIPLVALKGRMPFFKKLIEENSSQKVIKGMREIDFMITLYVVPMFLLCFFFSEYFMKLWLLEGYDFRMRLGLLLLMPTLSIYIYANARELFLITKGDSITTLGAYTTNALMLIVILIGTYYFAPNPEVTFTYLMSCYCLAHLFGSLYIYIRYHYSKRTKIYNIIN